MNWDDIFNIVCDVAKSKNEPVDEFCEYITDSITEDNGYNLSTEDVIELAEQYFEEED